MSVGDMLLLASPAARGSGSRLHWQHSAGARGQQLASPFVRTSDLSQASPTRSLDLKGALGGGGAGRGEQARGSAGSGLNLLDAAQGPDGQAPSIFAAADGGTAAAASATPARSKRLAKKKRRRAAAAASGLAAAPQAHLATATQPRRPQPGPLKNSQQGRRGAPHDEGAGGDSGVGATASPGPSLESTISEVVGMLRQLELEVSKAEYQSRLAKEDLAARWPHRSAAPPPPGAVEGSAAWGAHAPESAGAAAQQEGVAQALALLLQGLSPAAREVLGVPAAAAADHQGEQASAHRAPAASAGGAAAGALVRGSTAAVGAGKPAARLGKGAPTQAELLRWCQLCDDALGDAA